MRRIAHKDVVDWAFQLSSQVRACLCDILCTMEQYRVEGSVDDKEQMGVSIDCNREDALMRCGQCGICRMLVEVSVDSEPR